MSLSQEGKGKHSVLDKEKKNQEIKEEASGPRKEGTRPREVRTTPGTCRLGKQPAFTGRPQTRTSCLMNRTWKYLLEWRGGPGKMAGTGSRISPGSQKTEQIQ